MSTVQPWGTNHNCKVSERHSTVTVSHHSEVDFNGFDAISMANTAHVAARERALTDKVAQWGFKDWRAAASVKRV